MTYQYNFSMFGQTALTWALARVQIHLCKERYFYLKWFLSSEPLTLYCRSAQFTSEPLDPDSDNEAMALEQQGENMGKVC